MCINSVKETCFSQKYQKWIYQVLEMSSSIIDGFISSNLRGYREKNKFALWGTQKNRRDKEVPHRSMYMYV